MKQYYYHIGYPGEYFDYSEIEELFQEDMGGHYVPTNSPMFGIWLTANIHPFIAKDMAEAEEIANRLAKR